MKKILRTVALLLAIMVALAYTFGYNYLFKAIAKTYLRGTSSAAIDDAKLFSSNKILAAKPRIWQKDPQYNVRKLPQKLLEELKASQTASLLVVRNGKLLHEEYWNGITGSTPTNSFTMAMPVTVMLTGKAIEEGKIQNLFQKYSDFYQNYANVEFGKALTLYDLATMQAGLDWKDDYANPFSASSKAYYGNSLAEATFLKGFSVKPGTKFQYQSGSSQLLGFALRKAVNVPLASYLSKKLWIPLGMEQNAEWSTDENKMEKAFCCIHAISRDFAKLGELMLNNGKVDSIQLLNPDFVQRMRTPTKTSGGIYGMGTWIDNDNPVKHYFFQGTQGQYIIIVPQYQMVIVRTGSDKKQTGNNTERPSQARFIVNEIVRNYF